jgi:hypothetical protein
MSSATSTSDRCASSFETRRTTAAPSGTMARVDQVARSVAQAAIAERIVAAVPTILEEPSLHACHALAVEVPLQLGGQAQLAEQVPPRRSVELRAREVSPDPPMARADSAVGTRKQVPF